MIGAELVDDGGHHDQFHVAGRNQGLAGFAFVEHAAVMKIDHLRAQYGLGLFRHRQGLIQPISQLLQRFVRSARFCRRDPDARGQRRHAGPPHSTGRRGFPESWFSVHRRHVTGTSASCKF